MAFEDSAGLNVDNFYGPRTTTDGLGGHLKHEGGLRQMVIEFGELVPGETTVANRLRSIETLPANSLITRCYLDVETLALMTGTTPTILVGTNDSEVTNGFVVTEAQAEAAGITDLTSTLTGTWAAGLLVDTAVSVVLGGTSPTLATGGRYKFVIEYINVTK